ncbi:MAG TPA: SUMF1/EgtB/PvdO family nonheme iron enzyme [Polyangiaceae bacterium]|nr:SUMF1/EgtB/PvdO family nonheme iron enzyme [Polyangiaceae bacterium]
MRALYATAAVFVACAAAPLPEPSALAKEKDGAKTEEPRRTAPKTHASAKAETKAPATAPASVMTTKESKPAVAAPAGACPAGMKLVDGDYCSEVEQKCLHSWYDESNKKVVCEEFEPKSVCTGEKTHKRFCIDEYAWPNEKGVRPEVMNNFYQAEVKCAAVGKRMCTESEWTLACEGPEMKPFPYGYARDPGKCNGDRPWDSPNMKKVAQRDPEELARLWQGVPNGAQPECVSDYGVADLAGNTDDVVSSETYSTDFRGKFDSVHTGGPWYKGVRNQCRPKIYTHDEGFYYYFLSFRCCSNPDGEPNDPRTPKQIKAKKNFKTIEGYARFSVAEMKEKLEKKKRGECTCKPKDVLCKTMCGTLLGPGAKDVVLEQRHRGSESKTSP